MAAQPLAVMLFCAPSRPRVPPAGREVARRGRNCVMSARPWGRPAVFGGFRRDQPPGDEGEALVCELYADHGAMLIGYVTKLTGDRHLAEDIVQETLLRAWRNSAALSQAPGSPRGWLITVARNLVIDAVRAKRARPSEVAYDPLDAPPPRAVDGRDHAEDLANSMVVADALHVLSPEHRDALVQTYFHGRTAAEAAQVLGVPTGTVKSRVHYALQALRSTLGQSLDGER
jgi:RNA polymerase sigma-70 factor, ECF subfamily